VASRTGWADLIDREEPERPQSSAIIMWVPLGAGRRRAAGQTVSPPTQSREPASGADCTSWLGVGYAEIDHVARRPPHTTRCRCRVPARLSEVRRRPAARVERGADSAPARVWWGRRRATGSSRHPHRRTVVRPREPSPGSCVARAAVLARAHARPRAKGTQPGSRCVCGLRGSARSSSPVPVRARPRLRTPPDDLIRILAT